MHDAPFFSRRRIAGAAAALVALALGAPAVAQADSIAYIKAGNVFLATTDGAREYQVTFDGGYSTVSQADSGRMVALRGDHIRHLERDGRVIADIATPVSTTTDPTMQFKGPFDPAISPDGTRVAYTLLLAVQAYGPGLPAALLHVKRLYHGTGFTDPNRLTAWDEPGFKRRSGWIDAQLGRQQHGPAVDPYILPNEDTVLWSPSASDDSGLKRWFEDHAYSGKLKDVDHVAGQVGARQHRRRRHGRIHRATRSAASTRTTRSAARGAGRRREQAAREPDVRRADALEALLGGEHGRHPHGDAAEVHGQGRVPAVHRRRQAADRRRHEPGLGPGRRAGGPSRAAGSAARSRGRATRAADRPGPTTRPGGATVKLTVTKAKLAAALKKGLTLKLTGAKDGKHTVSAKYGKTTVAKGSVTVKSGAGKVTLKFTAAGKQQLKGKKTAKLAISGAGASLSYTLKK